jgi:hypothetical protein
VAIEAQQLCIDVPPGVKPGDTFCYEHQVPAIDKVIASTLNSVPGMQTIQSKPIIWASVSLAFSSFNQQSMGETVGSLLQEVQNQILRQAIKERCNAVLGIAFNVSNDSAGETGKYKVVIVTAYGTPCVVVPLSEHQQQVVVMADAFLVPSTPVAD